MGISMWQLLIVLLIVVLLFGTKRLKGIGADLGSAIKGFKKAVTDDDSQSEPAAKEQADQQAQSRFVEGSARQDSVNQDTVNRATTDQVPPTGEPIPRGETTSTTEDGQHKP